MGQIHNSVRTCISYFTPLFYSNFNFTVSNFNLLFNYIFILTVLMFTMSYVAVMYFTVTRVDFMLNYIISGTRFRRRHINILSNITPLLNYVTLKYAHLVGQLWRYSWGVNSTPICVKKTGNKWELMRVQIPRYTRECPSENTSIRPM